MNTAYNINKTITTVLKSSLNKTSIRSVSTKRILNNKINLSSALVKNNFMTYTTTNNPSVTRFGKEVVTNTTKKHDIDLNQGLCPNSELNIDLANISPHCYIEQINTKCLSQFGYYIESEGKAVVVDPVRDVEYYTELIKRRNSKLKYVAETHFHADFVSGHLELADKTDAKIVFGPGARPEFDVVETNHEMILEISDKIAIQILHTPGHTLESCCFAILEKTSSEVKPWKHLAVLTGDTLFLGDVGRPDLAVKSDLTSRDLAALMYSSIEYLKKLPDDCIVLPGHGAGSACGKNIQKGAYSTIGIQKKTNYAVNDSLSKEEFIEILISNLPTPPQYFFYDAIMNKKSVEGVEKILEEAKALEPEEFYKIMQEKDVKVIDARRNSKLYEEGLFPKAYSIDLSMTYAIWAATLMKPNDKILIICDEDNTDEAITRLTRVGFDNIIGYLKGGMAAWKEKDLPTEKIDLEHTTTFADKIRDRPFILDVRNEPEFVNPGILPGSLLIPLPTLEKNLDKIPKDKTIYILCRGAMRASIAASILRTQGFKNELRVIHGGLERLITKGVKPEPKI